ncbi:SDR family NAD(P)-dependent oxidoreductase [Parasporobacterium paucivorans]|uniref:Short-chain dehydrogenase n=1 Tax=Parasporobacterium paucivorans DSM 15970 TaxID=1122934 RepID=A0A1M6DQR9_9FIRM|nr:SDR family NAD(P)-dependent oxidoreductase [Parasporobacterium paucivorans]SHI75604.1 Short-chain dehydrogenase [Parasporobacterium paucivorans DSM 15970]
MRKEKRNGLIVITGCDTGIGKSLARILHKRGYTVVLSYMSKPPFGAAPGIYQRKMDLRIPNDIDLFCAFVKEQCSSGMRLEALVSNAGVALIGPVENLPIAAYRENFEINFFGAVKIIQSLIPDLIKNKGKIIINGSNAGRIAMPFLSPYVSTKYAIEGFSDSLRREMNPFGVKTVLLEPASVATPIWNNLRKQDLSFIDKKYLPCIQYGLERFISGGNQGLGSEAAGRIIADILETRNPKARYIISKNKLNTILLQSVPSIILDKAVKKIFKMDYGNK